MYHHIKWFSRSQFSGFGFWCSCETIALDALVEEMLVQKTGENAEAVVQAKASSKLADE